MTDIEKSLPKAINNIYPDCFFGRIFLPLPKCNLEEIKKNLGLVNKNYINILRFIIFGYKIYSFLKEEIN